MIIFGSNSSHLKSEHLTEVACPHCNESDCVDISVFGKYAHVLDTRFSNGEKWCQPMSAL